MEFEKCSYRQITNPTTHTIKMKDLEEPKVTVAKLHLDYHGKLLEFYRKVGHQTTIVYRKTL